MFSKIKNHTIKLGKNKSCNKCLILATKLGNNIAENKYIAQLLKSLGFHDYDLPLHKSEDSRFLTLLIALMSFLAVLACSGMFALNNMSDRWSSGLENKVTIEIAVETKNGHLLSNDTVKRETEKIAKELKNNKIVKSISILSKDDISELISPWIGADLKLAEIPLPGLIALELNKSDKKSLAILKYKINKISKYARLETHHEWLSDLIKFTNILKSLALFIALIIGFTTIIAIIAGMRTRLAIHKKEVNLLHHMGATDNYIARQFQRHAMILSFKGSILGTFLGLIISSLIVIISMNSGTSLIPKIQISTSEIIFLCLIPVIAAIIAAITSRFTVLRSLRKMP